MYSSTDALTCLSAGFPIRTSPTRHGHTPLVGAFRSVSRPSSASCAQASPCALGSFLLTPWNTEKLLPVLRVFARCLSLNEKNIVRVVLSCEATSHHHSLLRLRL